MGLLSLFRQKPLKSYTLPLSSQRTHLKRLKTDTETHPSATTN
jgi:hypothetical protein